LKIITSIQPDGSQAVDKLLLWSVFVLSAIGVVAVYSAISFLADTRANGNTERFLVQHVLRVVFALGVMGVFSIINYHVLARFARLVLFLSVGLLVLVQVTGVVTGGAARWLDIGIIGFQPSDLAKVALVLYVAVLLTAKQGYITSFTHAFLPIFFWILLTVALIGIDDLSTAALVLMSVLVMCFVARVPVVHIVAVGLVGVLLGYALLLTSPARAARVEAYTGMKLFPHTEEQNVFSSQGERYQVEQSKMAVAAGGLFGVGPGKSTQRDFLPAPYNDFIFAIVTEEYGLVGAFLLLGLFVLILFRGLFRVARHAPDPLGLFLALGLVVMLTLYAFVHVGVSVEVFPVTGLPLPFVSWGGTSMAAGGMMMGILLNISRHIE